MHMVHMHTWNGWLAPTNLYRVTNCRRIIQVSALFHMYFWNKTCISRERFSLSSFPLLKPPLRSSEQFWSFWKWAHSICAFLHPSHKLEAPTPETVATYSRDQLQLTSCHSYREDRGILCLLYYINLVLTIRFLPKQFSLDLNWLWDFFLSIKGSERFLEFHC